MIQNEIARNEKALKEKEKEIAECEAVCEKLGYK